MTVPSKTPVPPISDEEEARLQQLIDDDPDDHDLTDEELAAARPFAEAEPELAANIRRGRGRPPLESPKAHVSLRLSADVLEHYRSSGRGWQGRIDNALREAMAREQKLHS